MGYKCTPQIMGLTRGEPKGKGKHRADGGKILRELGEERHSKSKTLDRSRSADNQYTGFSSGQACWDKLQADADNYRVPVHRKDGTVVYRRLPGDAVIGCAVIFNPPAEMTVGWTADQYRRFYRDSAAVLHEIEPRVFGRWRMFAEHLDEGKDGSRHMHLVGVPKDDDGRYCGNLIDALLLGRINQDYPRLMRARGWDLEDLDTTDWPRYKADPDYRAWRDGKAARNGRSVNDYLRDIVRDTEARERALAEREKDMKDREDALSVRERALEAREAVIKGKDTVTRQKPVQAPQRRLQTGTGATGRIIAMAEEMEARDRRRTGLDY